MKTDHRLYPSGLLLLGRHGLLGHEELRREGVAREGQVQVIELGDVLGARCGAGRLLGLRRLQLRCGQDLVTFSETRLELDLVVGGAQAAEVLE